MLKNISPLISPELLKILAEMGHGDTIVLADGNYPAMSSPAKHILRADGIGVPALLEAILPYFPLDTFIEQPVSLMAVAACDDYTPELWAVYESMLAQNGANKSKIEFLERHAFYDKATQAYCVVATGERGRYGNIMLKKGVVELDEA